MRNRGFNYFGAILDDLKLRFDLSLLNHFQGQFHLSQQQETTFLYIPNNCVGAIIGPKGNNIRYLMKFSGASVKISQQQQQEGDPEANSAEQPNSDSNGGGVVDPNHRKVTIVGTPEAQWRAQYLIFEKICEEEYR